MDKQDDNTYLRPVNNVVLRETQTKGSETYALPTYNEFRYSLPSPPDSEDEQFDDDIATWSKEKVAKWIRSILQEVALYQYPSQQTLDLFIMDGKSLLYLSAEDLYQRDPDLGNLISEKLMDLQKKAYSSYSPDNCFYPLRSDPNMSQWYEKPYGSYSPSESSDSEIDIPCTSIHGHPAYIPLASNCATSLGYPDTLVGCPGYINTILPPFNPSMNFTPSMYGSQTSLEEAAITIKKEPNFTMHSPPGLYAPEHQYPQEHFPFPPACGPLRPINHVSGPNHVKRECLHVDPKGIEGIPKQAQLYEFILKVLNNPINQHILSWKDKSKGIFYINDTKAFARLWGLHRNSDNMSYEKLSRAMRYYYRRNILEQIKGRRLYKFTAQMNKQIMDE